MPSQSHAHQPFRPQLEVARRIDGDFTPLDAEAPARSRPADHRLLVLRFAGINLIGFALVGAAWMQGWVDLVLAADQTRLTAVIALTFLGGLAFCGFRVWRLSTELDGIAAPDSGHSPLVDAHLRAIDGRSAASRGNSLAALRLRLSSAIAPVRQVANALVLLGLIGTVVGFIIALSGVDPDSVADVHAISPMVSTLLNGMSVALYTTLIGAALNLWLMVNYNLLSAGATRLAVRLAELGERHVRS